MVLLNLMDLMELFPHLKYTHDSDHLFEEVNKVAREIHRRERCYYEAGEIVDILNNPSEWEVTYPFLYDGEGNIFTYEDKIIGYKLR